MDKNADPPRVHEKTSHGPLFYPTGFCDLGIFEILQGSFYLFFKINSLSPLNIIEHVFGHYGTLPSLRRPSWTFMDTQMNPKWTLQG